jgi:hypothetical protein
MNRVFIATGLALSLCFHSVTEAQQVPPPPAPADPDPVEDVKQLFSDLQAHQKKIEKAEVDDETKRLQDDILKIWDRLLDSAKQPPSSNQQSSDQNQSGDQNRDSQSNPDQQQGTSSSQPMGDQQPGEQAGKKPGEQEGDQDPDAGTGDPGQSTGRPNDKNADQADAEARLRQQSRLAQMRQEERERLMKEVWGKLPQRIRQKLLNASDEKYLPEYEDRIQEYFRKLSEPGNRTRTD